MIVDFQNLIKIKFCWRQIFVKSHTKFGQSTYIEVSYTKDILTIG